MLLHRVPLVQSVMVRCAQSHASIAHVAGITGQKRKPSRFQIKLSVCQNHPPGLTDVILEIEVRAIIHREGHKTSERVARRTVDDPAENAAPLGAEGNERFRDDSDVGLH